MPINEHGRWISPAVDERGRAVFETIDERGYAVFGVQTEPMVGDNETALTFVEQMVPEASQALLGTSEAQATAAADLTKDTIVSLKLAGSATLKAPSLTFDRVVIDANIPFEATTQYFIDVRGGSGAYIYRNSGGYVVYGTVVADIASFTASGADVRHGFFYSNSGRRLYDIKLAAVATDDVNILSRFNSVEGFRGNVYDVKIYNGETLVAHYDFTKGVTTDQSGNGRHAITDGVIAYDEANRELTSSSEGTSSTASGTLKKNGTPQYLAFNGSNDKLQLPATGMTSIELDVYIPSIQPNSNAFLVDARTGLANGYYSSSANLGSGWSSVEIDGVVPANQTLWLALPKDRRVKVKLIAGSSFTDDVTLFTANVAGSYYLKGRLYGVTAYLGSQAVIKYDMSKGNLLDLTGNARNGTLTGGAWIGDQPTHALLNGSTDKVVAPNGVIIDRIEMDVEVSEPTGSNLIDARGASSSLYVSSNGNLGGDWESITVNGLTATPTAGTPIRAYTRSKVSVKAKAEFTTSALTFFAHRSIAQTYNVEGKIFSVKLYRGETLQASYDMKTMSWTDQSGKGNNATMTGGTWVTGIEDRRVMSGASEAASTASASLIKDTSFYLSLNGAGDHLKTSSITFDEVIMDFRARQNNNEFYVDARIGGTNAYYYRASSGEDLTSSSGVFYQGIYWNGVKVTNSTIAIPYDTRGTLRLVANVDVTDDVTFFAINTGSANHMEADVYSIQLLLDGAVVANYDFSKGNVLDQSGNGNNATLVGGSWMAVEGGDVYEGEAEAISTASANLKASVKVAASTEVPKGTASATLKAAAKVTASTTIPKGTGTATLKASAKMTGASSSASVTSSLGLDGGGSISGASTSASSASANLKAAAKVTGSTTIPKGTGSGTLKAAAKLTATTTVPKGTGSAAIMITVPITGATSSSSTASGDTKAAAKMTSSTSSASSASGNPKIIARLTGSTSVPKGSASANIRRGRKIGGTSTTNPILFEGILVKTVPLGGINIVNTSTSTPVLKRKRKASSVNITVQSTANASKLSRKQRMSAIVMTSSSAEASRLGRIVWTDGETASASSTNAILIFISSNILYVTELEGIWQLITRLKGGSTMAVEGQNITITPGDTHVVRVQVKDQENSLAPARLTDAKVFWELHREPYHVKVMDKSTDIGDVRIVSTSEGIIDINFAPNDSSNLKEGVVYTHRLRIKDSIGQESTVTRGNLYVKN